MNNGTIAICDNDKDYGESLCDYFRIKGCLSSDIIVFTDYNSLSDYASNFMIDILIIHEDFYKLIDNIPLNNNIFILQEHIPYGSLRDEHYIYKYTSAEDILRCIMVNYNPAGTRTGLTFYKYRKSKLIAVCSPLGRCGKTSFAFSLSLMLSMKHSCLFLSFDDSSPLKEVLSLDNTVTTDLSDILYFFLQSPDSLENQLLSGTISYENLNIILPSKEAGIYSELSVEELLAFLSKIADLGRYDYIVLDYGLLSFVNPLLKLCDKAFILEHPTDYYSSRKVSIYLDALTCQSNDNSFTLTKISPPHITLNSNTSNYLLSISSGELSQYVKAIIDEHNL